jgi:hypothetical protein
MKTIYDNTDYKTAFDTHGALVAKAEALNAQECTQRAALGRWQPSTSTNALARALDVLNGSAVSPTTSDAAIQASKSEHAQTRLQIEAVQRGLPEAHYKAARLRDQLSRQRLTEPDVQKAIAKSVKAANALIEANAEMLALCKAVTQSGFAFGPSEMQEPLTMQDVDELKLWVNTLAGFANDAPKTAPVVAVQVPVTLKQQPAVDAPSIGAIVS